MQTQLAPLLQAGTDSIQSVVKVLGLPQQNYPFHADHFRAVETYTLQRLAEGKQQYTGYTLTTAMASSNAQIFRVFPFKEAQAIKFMHQYFDFNKELAVQTPAQSPPGYVEVQESSSETTLNRYALGATTTVQELKTSKGQFIWRGKLIIVAIAFIETSELLAIQTLLTVPSIYAKYFVASGQHPLDLARAGRMKDLFWDILRSRENGMSELIDSMKQEFSTQNIMPTHVILTEGMRSLIMASDYKKEYYRIGASANRNSTELGDAVGDTYAGVELIVVRPIELRKKDLRIAPLERLAVVGQHFRIDHFYQNCDLREWCSNYMAIQVFTMEHDMFEEINIENCLEADHRFNRADGKLSDHHHILAADPDNQAGNRGVPVLVEDKVPQYDMFLYTVRNTEGKVQTRVAALWGQMEHWALGNKAVTRTAETMRNLFNEIVDKKKIAAIDRGLEVIRELYEKDPTDTDTAIMSIAIDDMRGKPRPRYGVPMPPTYTRIGVTAEQAAARRFRPYGYGSVAGLLTLARVTDPFYDPELIRDAIAFREAIVPVHQLFIKIFGISHPALDPNNAPVAFRNNGTTSADRTANSMLNLFTNIFDVNKSTLFITKNAVPNAQNADVFEDIPETDASGDTNYRFLSQALELSGYPRALAPYFGTAERLQAFEAQFSASPLARQLARFLKQRTEAQQQRARRRRGAAPTDEDAAQAIVIDGDGSGASTLKQLHELLLAEVISPTDTDNFNTRIVAFYSRIVQLVVKRQELSPFDIDSLRALTGAGINYAGDESTNIVDAAARGNFVSTPFVGSLNSTSGLEATLRLASPFNPDQPVDFSKASNKDRAAVDATGPNIDVTKMTVFSGAKFGFGGSRRQAGSYGVDAGSQANSPFAGTRMPSFGSAEFQDVVGDELVTNKNLVDRFMQWGGVTDLMLRVCAQMFILAPITVHVLWAFKELNIAQPVAWLVEQPWRRYITTSAIFLSKPDNAPIGNIQWFDPDVHIGRNAINKNIMVHVSMYLGATVDDVHNWLVAYDIAVVGYRGGETTRPFLKHEWKNANINTLGLEGPSLLFFMVPADSLCGNAPDKTPYTHDIRGFSDAVHYSGNSVHRNSKFSRRPYHKSAAFYTSLWNLDKLHTIQREDWHSFHTYRDGTHNTATSQGFQRVYDPHTKQWDRNIMSQDVFKNNVYPGCRELRESLLPRVYKRDLGYENRTIAC